MVISCKNCGGELRLLDTSIVCDSCGASQRVNEPAVICSVQDAATLLAYRRATEKMNTAKSETDYALAASMFRRLGDLQDAEKLARSCAEHAAALHDEHIYQQAVDAMNSGYYHALREAKAALESIPQYKDALDKAAACIPLLEEAKKRHLARLHAEQKRKEHLKKRRILAVICATAVILLVLLLRACTYSADHVHITLSPSDNYLTVKSNRCIFTYQATIKNRGTIDISRIAGTIVFEDDDNNVIVDTGIQFNSSSSAVVRAKKTSRYTWELTVYDDSVAQILYEHFDDLRITVDIDEIVYTDGTRKTY